MPTATLMDADRVSPELAREFHRVYRSVRFNAVYYGRRLAFWQLVDKSVGVAVAVGTSASVAGLAIWKSDPGRDTFAALVAIAIVLSAVRPILNLSGLVGRLTKVWTTYNGAFETLDRLHSELKVHDGFVSSVEAQLLDVMARVAGVAPSEDPFPDITLREQTMAEVRREMPVTSLWMPAPFTDRA